MSDKRSYKVILGCFNCTSKHTGQFYTFNNKVSALFDMGKPLQNAVTSGRMLITTGNGLVEGGMCVDGYLDQCASVDPKDVCGRIESISLMIDPNPTPDSIVLIEATVIPAGVKGDILEKQLMDINTSPLFLIRATGIMTLVNEEPTVEINRIFRWDLGVSYD